MQWYFLPGIKLWDRSGATPSCVLRACSCLPQAQGLVYPQIFRKELRAIASSFLQA